MIVLRTSIFIYVMLLYVHVDTSVMQRLKDENMEDYIQLLHNFESKKRTIDNTKADKITITVPVTFFERVYETTGQSMKDKLQTSGYGKQVSFVLS